MTYSKFKNFEDYCKQQLFKDDQGFSELPYISNNPDLMLDSIRQLPIATWHPKLSAVTTANDFFTGDMRRINFEPGLSLFATKLDVKKNILCKALFDSKKKARHYFLSFAVFEYPFQLIDNGKRTITLYPHPAPRILDSPPQSIMQKILSNKNFAI